MSRNWPSITGESGRRPAEVAAAARLGVLGLDDVGQRWQGESIGALTNSLTISSVSVRHFRPYPNRLGQLGGQGFPGSRRSVAIRYYQ